MPAPTSHPDRRAAVCPFHPATAAPSAATPPVRAWRHLPHPPGWPLLGQLPGFDVQRTHLTLEQWARQLGTPYRFSMGPGYRGLVFDDPELAHTISRQRPDQITRGSRLQPVMAEMGFNGLFSAEGERWREQRKLVMGALNASHLRTWLPTLGEITVRLAQRWTQAAMQHQVLEMNDELKRYTVDVTSTLAFGQDPRTLSEGTQAPRGVQADLQRIFPAILRRTMTPISHWHWFKLPADRALDRSVAAVHAHALRCIEAARLALQRDRPAAPRHTLEAMLMQQQGGLTDADVLANVVTLLLGGEDTTAHTLAWTLFHLAREPERQAAMSMLAAQVLRGADAPADMAAFDALAPFEHLALEAMRLHPVVPFNVFEPKADAVIGGVAVKAHTKLFFLARPAMLDASRFPEPQRFWPERWAQGQRSEAARAFLPFGAGARVCPGRSLAMAEVRLVLAMLLQRFHLALATDPASVHEVSALTMSPSHMPVRLRLRLPCH